jgi:hypothetical protein
MNGWLLDTNIISELRKPNCHPTVKQWTDSQPPQSFYLSTVTLAEIRFGIEQTNDIIFRHHDLCSMMLRSTRSITPSS